MCMLEDSRGFWAVLSENILSSIKVPLSVKIR